VVCLLNLSGIPPFRIFYFKASLISAIIENKGLGALGVLLVGSAVFMFLYLRVIIRYFSIVSSSLLKHSSGVSHSGALLLNLLVGNFLFLILRVSQVLTLRLIEKSITCKYNKILSIKMIATDSPNMPPFCKEEASHCFLAI